MCFDELRSPVCDAPSHVQGTTPLRSYGVALYESIAILPGCGGHTPRTFAGRTLYLLWGVVLVVMTAWYTGDLAGSQAAEAFTSKINTISELQRTGRAVCYPSSAAFNATADALEAETRYALSDANIAAQPVSVPPGTNLSTKIMIMEMEMARTCGAAVSSTSCGCSAMIVPEKGCA